MIPTTTVISVDWENRERYMLGVQKDDLAPKIHQNKKSSPQRVRTQHPGNKNCAQMAGFHKAL
jgi:hypothetical protein